MFRDIRSKAKVNKLGIVRKAQEVLRVCQNLTFDVCEWHQWCQFCMGSLTLPWAGCLAGRDVITEVELLSGDSPCGDFQGNHGNKCNEDAQEIPRPVNSARRNAWSAWSACYCCFILIRTEICRQILVKLPGIKFYESPFSRSQVVICGQTDGHIDMATFIGAFLQLFVATVPKNGK
jgi:hypothetical protein